MAESPHLAKRCEELQGEVERLTRVCAQLRWQKWELTRVADTLQEILGLHRELGCWVELEGTAKGGERAGTTVRTGQKISGELSADSGRPVRKRVPKVVISPATPPKKGR